MEMSVFVFTLVCLALVSGVGCLIVTIPLTQYEFARGDNITLPCTFQSKLAKPKLVIITWTANAIVENEEDIVVGTYYSIDGSQDIAPQYEGRAFLDVTMATGTANLKLSSITLVDNKQFECRVQIPLDDVGTPADTARLIVLVAPSPPICKIQGKTEYGQNINLTCLSEEGSPTPTYKWDSRDVRNMPRIADPKTTDKGGILSLYNISKDTSGYYICTASNKIRSATCNLTLAVMPPSMLGSVGQTAGIIAGVVAALFLLIIVIYCCCCRKKGKDEEYVMGDRVEEYHDKEATENGETRAAVPDDRSERGEDRRERPDDRRTDYDDRRSDYDDRRSDYNDRRSDYNDRRSDYDNRRTDYDDHRSDYDDRRSDYDDRRSDYDDRRSDYSDRRGRYNDRNERYDDNPRRDDRRDRRYDDDRHYDEAHDDRPPVPLGKPQRRD